MILVEVTKRIIASNGAIFHHSLLTISELGILGIFTW